MPAPSSVHAPNQPTHAGVAGGSVGTRGWRLHLPFSTNGTQHTLLPSKRHRTFLDTKLVPSAIADTHSAGPGWLDTLQTQGLYYYLHPHTAPTPLFRHACHPFSPRVAPHTTRAAGGKGRVGLGAGEGQARRRRVTTLFKQACIPTAPHFERLRCPDNSYYTAFRILVHSTPVW